MDSKQILTLNKRQSIVQRIDAMKASFSANKIKDKLSRYHYFGYPSQLLVDKLIGKISSNTVDKNSLIAVVNDFGLEVISQLQLLGYTNLILLCTESDDKLYNIIKYMVEKEFNFTSIERLQDMRIDDKFDLVIANPPYEIGNAVITETMKHCEEAVVLMPIRDYRSQGTRLYKKITELELVDPKNFDGSGAYVQHGLSICSLNHNDNKKNWEDIELETFDQNFRLVYEWNIKHTDERTFTETLKYNSSPEEFNQALDFLYSVKIVSPYNGVYFGGLDYAYNTGIDFRDKWISSIVCLHFNDSMSKQNFTKWWYSSKNNSGLTTKLLWGMNKTSCPLLPAIPVINWSRTNVEYTDEYVLSQMGLKWNENKAGVEKL